MFYGQGAGAGATASAVVGDLMQIMRSGRNIAEPVMEKTADGLLPFESFTARQYIALEPTDREKIEGAFGAVEYLDADGEVAFITDMISEGEAMQKLCHFKLKSRIRLI